MVKSFAVALLALAMSVGLAQAKHMHRHVIPGCTPGHPSAAKCACGTAMGHPLLCQPGQWCHPNFACTK